MGQLSRRIFWVGLVAALVQSAGGPGIARADIVIDTGQFEDIPDPNGLYIFHSVFRPIPGEEILFGNSFTVYGIQHGFPGVDTSTQPANWGSSIVRDGGTPSDPTYDVTWTYVGTNAITTTTDLGNYTYEVSGRPDSGLPITLPYTWITTLNGAPHMGSGSVVVTAVVPEPPPIVLAGCVAVLGLVAAVARRALTRRSRPAAPTAL
jgi:hypothetical protein